MICAQVRDLVHAADPAVEETIKRTVQPYFVLPGDICALLGEGETLPARPLAGPEAAGVGLTGAAGRP